MFAPVHHIHVTVMLDMFGRSLGSLPFPKTEAHAPLQHLILRDLPRVPSGRQYM